MDLKRRAGLKRWWPKISSSAWKVTVVPRRLLGGAEFFDRAQGHRRARSVVRRARLVAGDLHDHGVAERVDDRGADAVQTAGGLVGLAGEFAARVQRAEDDLERGFVGEFRVRIDGDAAAIVADGDGVIGVQLDLDPVGVAGDGLVHRVVQHLGHQVVQRAFIGAADIHAGAFADRFQPLKHLDRGGGSR